MKSLKSYTISVLLLLSISITAQAEDTKSFKSLHDEALNLTNQCWKLREKNPDSAIILGIRAKEIAENNSMQDIVAKVSGYLGVIYFHYKFDMKTAVPYLQESLIKSMLVNDSTRMAYSYNNLGDVYMMSGNYPLALKYSEESIRIFINLNDLKGIAYGYINMGLIYQEERKYEKAHDYFRKALNIRAEIGDSTGYASALYQLARSQQYQGKLDSALANYKKSYDHHIKINNVSYTASCLNGLATVYYMKGDYPKSLDNFLNAIDLHKQKKHNFGLVEDYLGIAMVYTDLDMNDKAEEALNKALDLSTKLEVHPKVLETYKAFAEFYQSIDNKDAALKALNKFVVLYDSVLFLQQIEVLEEVTSNYETKQSLQTMRQELDSKKSERKYMIIIIILMMIIVAFFIWRVNFQNKMNRRLKEANDTKNKLFSVISHDLRSPFNTILGFSEILKTNIDKKDSNAVEYSDIIYQQSLETVRLIDNLLTWSRSQSNKIRYNPNPTDIEQLFTELNASFDYLITKNKLSIEFDNHVKRNLKIDRNIINIILTNLISNSLKYTPEGGKVNVSAAITNKKLEIIVKDNGIGIAGDTLKKLRENQMLESSKGIRNEGGTGLGISICNELVKLHNGKMNITSTQGEGTEITLSITLN